jgi:hypothetical protein
MAVGQCILNRYGVATVLGLGIVGLSQGGCELDAPVSKSTLSPAISCGQDVQCPSGSRCGGNYLRDESPDCSNAEGIDPNVYQHCQAHSAPARPGALHEYFEVDRLPATLQRTAAGPELLWENDERGRFVSCAIFGCEPEFSNLGSAAEIANYGACVLADAVLPSASAKFDLASAAPRDLARDCGRATGCQKFQADSLTVGCWMYDSHSIVAATELIPLVMSDVSAIPELAAHFSQTCGEEASDGRSCKRPTEERFGTCLNHECRPRCMTILECTSIVYTPAGDGGAPNQMIGDQPDICSQKCVAVPDTGIGVCTPRGRT